MSFPHFARALPVATLFTLTAATRAHAEPPPAQTPAPAASATPPVEVTIAGTRVSRTAGSAHLITRRQLERFAYTDPQAIVQQVPGVYVRQEDGVGLRPNIGVRGVNPDRSKKLTLMEDGVLFGPAPYSAPAAYYFPLMARMVGVRVIKGPGAVAYGPQSVGGAIDFVTRPIPARTQGAAALSLGQYDFGQLHAHFGSSNEQVGFLIEGVRLWNTGFKQLPNGADTGSTRDDWMAKFSYVPNPAAVNRDQFLLKLAYADEVSNESYLGLSDADFRRDPYQRYAASALDQMKNHRSSVVLTHTFEMPERALTLKTSLYRHDYARVWRKLNHFNGAGVFGVLRDPEDPKNAEQLDVLRGRADSATAGDTLWIGPNDRAFVSEGAQSQLNLALQQGELSERIEIGARLHHDRIIRRHSEDAFSMQGGALIPAGLPTSVTAANRDESIAFATHALAALTYRALTVTPGVRVELIRSRARDYLAGGEHTSRVAALLPGIGVYSAVSEDFGLLAGIYRGFSPPAPGSGEAAKPEYSLNYEAGARFSRGALRAELIAFYNHYSNLTDVCTISSGCLTENLDRQFDAGKARIYGLEAYAAHELPLSERWRLPFMLGYTLTRAQFLNDFTSQDAIYGSVRAGDEMPYVPRHQLKTSIGVERGRDAHFAVALSYVSRMREEAGSAPLSESLATDEQFWLDASAGVAVWGPLSLYGHARNVLNAAFIVSRRPYGARPNPPRWLEAGVRLEL